MDTACLTAELNFIFSQISRFMTDTTNYTQARGVPQIVNSLGPSDVIWRLILGQHWFRQWFVAWRHQAIAWTNIDVLSTRSPDIYSKVSITMFCLQFTY